MDPQTRAFLDAIALADQPSITTMTPPEAREVFRGLEDIFLPTIELPSVTDHRTSGGVPFRLYRPTEATDEPLPLTVYYHGGGWVLGDLETHDTLCRHLAQSSQVAIASVDYRRAPEHPFPIPLEDCEDALHYLVTHAAQFKIDPDRLALAGDSAGGNLAAAVCCKVHEEGGPSVRLQLLVYPVISAGCDTPSYESFAEGYGLTGDEMRWFWRAYLGGATEPPTLASLDLRRPPSNLPFTRILTAEYDVLRDEAERYAATLKEAGIEVELSRHEGLIHGFFHFCGAMDRGRELVQSTGEWLGQQLRKTGEDPPLSREAQMAKFEEALKNDDWGHQPC